MISVGGNAISAASIDITYLVHDAALCGVGWILDLDADKSNVHCAFLLFYCSPCIFGILLIFDVD